MEGWQIENAIQGVLAAITVVLVAYSPIFRALGNRIMHGKTLPPGQSVTADTERVDQLSGEVAALRNQLYETQERLDFTERMLAQAREKGALPPGGAAQGAGR